MEFAVHVLEVFFDLDHDTAKQRMLFAHHQGTVECGLLTNWRRKGCRRSRVCSST
jgi:ATP-dependent Clp protease adapter protein ClpS